MTWREHCKQQAIPVDPEYEAELAIMPVDTRACLDFFIDCKVPELDALTEGDETKERALGNMLVRLARSSASTRERFILGMPTYAGVRTD